MVACGDEVTNPETLRGRLIVLNENDKATNI